MPGINRFFNKTVSPHSLGPAIIHLRLSGNGKLTVILLSAIHDRRLPLTLINKFSLLFTGEEEFPLGLPHCEQGLSLCLVGGPRT